MAYLPRIRAQVALATRHKVSGWWDGVHSAMQSGRSLEFYDVREYVRGDDTSDIDWKASARHGSLLVKRHVAERRTTLILAVATDLTLNGMASPLQRKRDVAITAAGTLAALALASGDYVGLTYWADGRPRATRPATRDVAAERMLGLIADGNPAERSETDLSQLLAFTAHSIRRRGIVAVICGDIDIDADLEARLRRLVAQHEVLLITIPDIDPTDPTIEDREVVSVRNGRPLLREFRRDPQLRREYLTDRQERSSRRSSAAARLSIPHVHLEDTTAVVPQLLRLVRSLGRGT